MLAAVPNSNDNIELFDIDTLDQIQNVLGNTDTDDTEIFNGNVENQNNPIALADKDIKTTRFPELLYAILEKDEYPSLISWCLDYNSFIVYDAEKFEECIMPRYFRSSRWASFIKQLNVYGFERAKDRDLIIYFHRDFDRNKPNVLKKMRRIKCT